MALKCQDRSRALVKKALSQVHLSTSGIAVLDGCQGIQRAAL